MPADSRCYCGCRIFFDLKFRITTASGGAFDIPSAVVVECVNCGSRSQIIGDLDGGKKQLVPFVNGIAAERELFLMALKDWKNEHSPDRNPDFITIEATDKLDFARLGLNEVELRK